MAAAPHIPLIVTALLFAALAAFDWRRMPAWGRVHLGVATAFGLAALSHPGATIADLLEGTPDGLVYLVAAARMAGLLAALVTVGSRMRERASL